MIKKSSMLPLVENFLGGLRRAARVVVAAWVLNSGFMAEADAGSLDALRDLRRHGPLFEGLAEPPPIGSEGGVYGKALLGEPLAPFVFSGVMDIADAAFESDAEYLIGGSPAVINTHDGATAHLSGSIGSVPGSPHGLIKLGAGTLALSGSNSYLGTTFLLQGGLQVRSDSAWGWASLQAGTGTRLDYAPGVVMASPLRIAQLRVEDWVPPGSYGPVAAPEYADELRWSVGGGQAVHAGLLQGDAPFVKQGEGRLSIAGDALGYTGQALVEQGALAVNEMFGGSILVGAGARLEGVGMVGSARVLPGGILAPGNSMGTLMVNGDLRFDPGSRFEVEVDPGGAGDAVWAGGKASLAGDVTALARAGIWQPSTSYTLLTAERGFDGSRFDSVSVSTDFAFLEPRLSYGSNTVTLTLLRNETPLDDVAETPDEKEVVDAVDDAAGGGSADLLDEMLMLDRPRARNALRQLSGSWSASVLSGLTEDSRFVRQAALGNVQAHGFWSRGFHSSARRSGIDGVAGYRRRLGGLVLGASHVASSGWKVGGFFGVQHATLRRDGGSNALGSEPGGHARASVQTTHLGMVASGDWLSLQLAAGASYAWHMIGSRRRVAFGRLDENLSGRYGAGTAQVFAEAAWPLSRYDAVRPPSAGGAGFAVTDQGGHFGRPDPLRLEPFLRFAYVRTHARGFEESGGAAALSVLPARQSLLFSTLGMRMEQEVETRIGALRLQGELAWRYAGGARQAAVEQSFGSGIGNAAFTSHGLPVARSAWSLALGAAAQVSRQAGVSMAYAGQFAQGVRDHGVRLNMRWVF